MKAYKNNIREVIEIVAGETVKTVQVVYFSGRHRYYFPDEVPLRIKDFMKWARTVKEYPVFNLNRITRHYY